MKKRYDIETSGAFVEQLILEPYKSGTLDGLRFAVKDNIDLKGSKTSYGSKPWSALHHEAVYNALCVELLLSSGATCIGKTIADEFTYSLGGESYFFGTPINPKARDRIPGGSSSGSASAVACGLVDFSIGTDSGGSIRVPASLCGIWGIRPSLHRISEAGVLPYTPSVSTVGAFSNDISTLDKVMRVLLCSVDEKPKEIQNIFLLEDALTIADEPVRIALKKSIAYLTNTKGLSVSSISLSDIVGKDYTLEMCNTQALRFLQSAEFMNTVGGWIETFNPEKGPDFRAAYENLNSFNRTELTEALCLCEMLHRRFINFMGDGDLFLFPTTPTLAPRKGSLNKLDVVLDFYDRTMAITSFSGIGRNPELSTPITAVDGVPVGLSLAAGVGQDEFLLSAAQTLLGDIELPLIA